MTNSTMSQSNYSTSSYVTTSQPQPQPNLAPSTNAATAAPTAMTGEEQQSQGNHNSNNLLIAIVKNSVKTLGIKKILNVQ